MSVSAQQPSADARRLVVALAAGLVFGLGLAISQMVNPAKVLAFLNVLGIADGTWDPSLALVMGGALAVTIPGFRLLQARPGPLFDAAYHLPTRGDIDRNLVLGAVLFGIGWGVTGLCPGPALGAALGLGNTGALTALVGMLLGMMVARRLV